MTGCQPSPPRATREAQLSRRLVVVDESSEILEICSTLFRAAGYEVSTFKSGGRAIEFLSLQPADAVIIDDTLSDMCGSDLAQAIKKVSKSTVVVMYSSRLGPEENIPGLDSYLSKENGPLALRSRLNSLLGYSR